MLQPVGPLPPEVYWRRRVVAVAGLVVVLVVLFWVGSAVAGGSPSPTGSAAAPAATTTSAPPTTTATSTPPAPATTTGTSTTVPAPATTTAPVTPATTVPATTTAPAPTGPPTTCPDASVVLTAQVAAPQYKVGEEPVFRILVSTNGTVPCTRALDAGLQQVVVSSADGTQRLWSSNDCFPGTGTETKTLNPGEQTAYSIRWSGTTSAPGCTAPRTVVPAGSYTVVVGLGGLTSAPVPFTLV